MGTPSVLGVKANKLGKSVEWAGRVSLLGSYKNEREKQWCDRYISITLVSGGNTQVAETHGGRDPKNSKT